VRTTLKALVCSRYVLNTTLYPAVLKDIWRWHV